MSVRLIFAIIAAFMVCGCSSPLEKSVLHPLKAKEIDRVVGKDKSFLATYSIVEEKWNYISSPQDSARWKDITYGRLHSFLNTINSPELNSPLFSKLREKWEELNSRNNIAADSIIEEWRGYLSSNSPDSLVSASFTGVELEKVRNINKEVDTLVKAGIKLKALKGRIDSLSFLYSFTAEGAFYTDSLESTIGTNPVFHRRAVGDSVVIKVFPDLTPYLRRCLIGKDTSVRFHYLLQSVYVGGRCFNLDSLKNDLPEAVLALIEGDGSADSPDFDANYYREQIIKEQIDPGFISQSAYIKINAEQYYRQLDSLVFSYINYRGAL